MIELPAGPTGDELEDAADDLAAVIDAIEDGSCDPSPLCLSLLLDLQEAIERRLAAGPAIAIC